MFESCYEEYLRVWLDGIPSELDFWIDFMKSKGGIYKEGFDWTIQKNKRFTLEDELPNDPKRKYEFIDIGSGPFSRCGCKTDKVDLRVTAIDPLGEAYEIMKEKYDLKNGIVIESGHAELLEHIFPENSFDMVHMSNAMDHCFDAIAVMYQLLYICKIGGKIILRHHENEAENENYQGFHQWNLSLHNEENSFVIWRDDKRYDVCKIFGEFADFELIPDCRETDHKTNWVFNKVVIIKKKSVHPPVNDYLRQYTFMLNRKYIKEIGKKQMDCYDKSRNLQMNKWRGFIKGKLGI